MVKHSFKMALAQMSCRQADKDGNLTRIKKAVANAKKRGAELVVFPELSLTGYVVRDELYGLAERIPGPSVEFMEDVAKKNDVHVVFGMPEVTDGTEATLHNTAVLIGPKGYIGKYRKMYLPTHSVFEEKRYFRPGYETTVFDTELGKLGFLICYDIYFPEVTRLARLNGAQLIICISASPSIRRTFFEALTIARAIENTAYFAFVNLAGTEDGLQFWGGSRLVGPNGRVLVQAKYDEDDLVVGEVDYRDIRSTETFVPLLKDIRPELFDQLKFASEKL
jgi:predicted amidohydrolase